MTKGLPSKDASEVGSSNAEKAILQPHNRENSNSSMQRIKIIRQPSIKVTSRTIIPKDAKPYP